MSLSQRQLVGIASDIRDQLQTMRRDKQSQVQGKLANMLAKIQPLEAIRRKLDQCQARSWSTAHKKITKQIEVVLGDLSFQRQQVEEAIQACELPIPKLADIHNELTQADREFGSLAYHTEGDLLAVTTEAIELFDVYLGEFEIQLHLPSLAEMRYNTIYRIYALDPRPAASNSCVTHPHVSDERLCSGDAGAAINMALSNGRICDFFQLVNSVLTTYNPGSPYVSLDNWCGVTCYDCGYITGEDDVRWCHSCNHDYCDECSSYCHQCEETICAGCLESCNACEESVCPSCRDTCPECGEVLCKTCLEELACPCLENLEEINNEQDTTTTETIEAA